MTPDGRPVIGRSQVEPVAGIHKWTLQRTPGRVTNGTTNWTCKPWVLVEHVTDPDGCAREGVARALDLLLRVDSQLHNGRDADPWPFSGG
jgi:hypothetical protein